MKLKDQKKKFLKNIFKNIIKAGHVVESEMHQLVARKSGDLDESIKTDPPQITRNKISVSIGSEGVFYARIVELGVKGRTYNYRRDGKVVYTGVGQKWARRSLLNALPKIRKILIK